MIRTSDSKIFPNKDSLISSNIKHQMQWLQAHKILYLPSNYLNTSLKTNNGVHTYTLHTLLILYTKLHRHSFKIYHKAKIAKQINWQFSNFQRISSDTLQIKQTKHARQSSRWINLLIKEI